MRFTFSLFKIAITFQFLGADAQGIPQNNFMDVSRRWLMK